jgi:hypothetical protein
MPVRFCNARASNSAWLNPRRHLRIQCRGIGTSTSKVASRGKARLSSAPNLESSGATPSYLKTCMSFLNVPSYSP